MNTTVLLVGVGKLGSLVLDLLLRHATPLTVVVGAKNVDDIVQRVNLALLVANQLGYFHDVRITTMDVEDVDRTAATLHTFKPDIVFLSVCLQSWWVIRELPAPIFSVLDNAQVGPWLPMHLTLVHKFMRAVQSSGIDTTVVNSSYPDVVNPALARIGLAPLVGIGNVANVIPGLRRACAQVLDAQVSDVELSLFAHHYVSHRLSAKGDTGDAPYHLSVRTSGSDQHIELDHSHVFRLLVQMYKRPGGLAGMPITASSAYTVLRALLSDKEQIVHVPGPLGLEGGYAVRLSSTACELALPYSITKEFAREVNCRAQQFDGIQCIAGDGTIHFQPEHMEVMRKVLGYSCRSMTIEDSHGLATELTRRYRELLTRGHAIA